MGNDGGISGRFTFWPFSGNFLRRRVFRNTHICEKIFHSLAFSIFGEGRNGIGKEGEHYRCPASQSVSQPVSRSLKFPLEWFRCALFHRRNTRTAWWTTIYERCQFQVHLGNWVDFWASSEHNTHTHTHHTHLLRKLVAPIKIDISYVMSLWFESCLILQASEVLLPFLCFFRNGLSKVFFPSKQSTIRSPS